MTVYEWSMYVCNVCAVLLHIYKVCCAKSPVGCCVDKSRKAQVLFWLRVWIACWKELLLLILSIFAFKEQKKFPDLKRERNPLFGRLNSFITLIVYIIIYNTALNSYYNRQNKMNGLKLLVKMLWYKSNNTSGCDFSCNFSLVTNSLSDRWHHTTLLMIIFP